MPHSMTPEEFLAACAVSPDVFELRPDYRAQLLVVSGIDARKPSAAGEEMLVQAEARAAELLAETPVDQLPHIADWRKAYRAFGAKPQRTRNSLEALTRRAEKGLPRINALTDVYNAISVRHQIPLGGEDFDLYTGPAVLTCAVGDEEFDTVASGDTVIENPDPGEVVWRDDAGVTCRRWNWRQGRRTALTDDTTTAFFIMDALGAMTDEQLDAALSDLIDGLSQLGDNVAVATRRIGAKDFDG